MRNVKALTVRSPPLLSFAKKYNAENRLPMMNNNANTMMILNNMLMSNQN